MRIQRFIGKDMRSVLAQVREALGEDAVILSSGKVGTDVEVTAAIDQEVQQAVAHAAARPAQPVLHAAIRPAAEVVSERGNRDNSRGVPATPEASRRELPLFPLSD